jgi:pimeloyl-ACP methyl ester carboxylesterase
MAAKDLPAARIEAAARRFEELVELIRSDAPYADVEAFLAVDDEPAADLREFAFWPADPPQLDLIRRWADHEPRPALERIRCPVLALFGGSERVVPVDESVAVYRAAFADRPELLRIEILPGANHRLMAGDPPALHPEYASILGDWISDVDKLRGPLR